MIQKNFFMRNRKKEYYHYFKDASFFYAYYNTANSIIKINDSFSPKL